MKPSALQLLSRDAGDSEEEEAGDSGDDAAQDILDAIHDRDAGALNLALKRHYEVCKGSEEPDGDEEEPTSERY